MTRDSATNVYLLAAYHEAGHAVAAVFWGLGLRSVRLNSDGTGQTVHRYRSDYQSKREILCLKAGPSAAMLAGLKGGLPLTEVRDRTTGAHGDYRDIAEILSGFPEDEREGLDSRLGLKVVRWISRPDVWTAVETVALMLLDRPVLWGPECRAVIKTALGRRLSRWEREALVRHSR